MTIRTTVGVAFITLALAVAAPAQAQDDPRILYCGPFGFESNPINGALSNLGWLDDTTVLFQDEPRLLAALRDGPWDLVIIRWFDIFRGADTAAIIDELAAYVDGGGRLMFSMARLDEQPELWPVLGIESAVDLVEPLQDIFTAYGRDEPTMRHPAFAGLVWRASDDPFLPPSNDYGDSLRARSDAFVVAEFGDDATGAIVVSCDGRVIVNGQHWDYWESGIRVAEYQLKWLLGCPADLDGDGELTVFDYFEFQNRFDSGAATGFADFDYDGRLDVFDFLEYLNLFDAGC